MMSMKKVQDSNIDRRKAYHLSDKDGEHIGVYGSGRFGQGSETGLKSIVE